MVSKGNTEKISVTLPKDLTLEVRSLVARGKVSSFFTEAVTYYLAYHKQKSAIEKSYGIWQDKDHPELATAEDSIKYVRSLRARDSNRLKIQRLHSDG